MQALKNAPGKDILAYGRVEFVSAMVANGLIDEYHFLVNPVAIGAGLSIFKEKSALQLKSSIPNANEIVVNTYSRGS